MVQYRAGGFLYMCRRLEISRRRADAYLGANEQGLRWPAFVADLVKCSEAW